MKQTIKRSLSLFMVLAMLITLVPTLILGASAENVKYVYASNGKYIYNWGTRGTTATFLPTLDQDHSSTGHRCLFLYQHLDRGPDLLYVCTYLRFRHLCPDVP